MFARTISADAGPFATSKDTSNWNPLGRSSNFTMGTLAFAMSWIFLAIPFRDSDSASALRQVAGDLHPLPSITASISEFGRYMPVANDPCTSNLAPGQIESTAPAPAQPPRFSRTIPPRWARVPAKVHDLVVQTYERRPDPREPRGGAGGTTGVGVWVVVDVVCPRVKNVLFLPVVVVVVARPGAFTSGSS